MADIVVLVLIPLLVDIGRMYLRTARTPGQVNDQRRPSASCFTPCPGQTRSPNQMLRTASTLGSGQMKGSKQKLGSTANSSSEFELRFAANFSNRISQISNKSQLRTRACKLTQAFTSPVLFQMPSDDDAPAAGGGPSAHAAPPPAAPDGQVYQSRTVWYVIEVQQANRQRKSGDQGASSTQRRRTGCLTALKRSCQQDSWSGTKSWKSSTKCWWTIILYDPQFLK